MAETTRRRFLGMFGLASLAALIAWPKPKQPADFTRWMLTDKWGVTFDSTAHRHVIVQSWRRDMEIDWA